MTKKAIRVCIAGTHSTGKSTFLTLLNERLRKRSLRIVKIDDLARRAREIGFPILTEHTYESTLWIMAEGLRREAEASLSNDVIIVDRPIFDALGYLEAALEISGRSLDERRLGELRTMARIHSTEYDLVIVTVPNFAIPLAPGRDGNSAFRLLAARHISQLAEILCPNALKLTFDNASFIVEEAEKFIFDRCGI